MNILNGSMNFPIESSNWYQLLINDLIETKKKGLQTIIEIKHILGKRLLLDELKFERAEYGKKTIATLAKDVGISKQELYFCMAFVKKFPELSDVSDNLTWHKIVHKYLPLPSSNNNYPPSWLRFFDVWNFPSRETEQGREYPGSIPAGIVFNTLYYFSNPGNIIVDPMAGGGVVYDTATEMERVPLCYDINPSRPEIQRHNIEHGFPRETQDCDLIFIDPPYYKKKEKEYGSTSISAYSRKEYLDFFDQLAENSYKTLKKEGILAFLMSNYIDYVDRKESIWVNDYLNKFKKAGFNLIMEIQCPLSTQQYTGFQVNQAKEKKKILIISRSLLILVKHEN